MEIERVQNARGKEPRFLARAQEIDSCNIQSVSLIKTAIAVANDAVDFTALRRDPRQIYLDAVQCLITQSEKENDIDCTFNIQSYRQRNDIYKTN